MEQRLIARIRELETKHPERARIAERLLEAIAAIDREFRGEERERLLRSVAETLDHLVELGEQSQRVENALARLQAALARLGQLVEFLSPPPAKRTLH
jgi:hypothetical protein